MMRRHIAGLVLLATFAAGCGDDPSEPESITAEFTLEVTGSMEEAAEGPAVFGSDVGENGQEVWATMLGDEDSRHVVVIGREGAGRPAKGSYTISGETEAGELAILHIVSEGEELVEIFVPETATIRITESSASVVRGTFEYSATGMLGGPGSDVEVEGSFVAVPVTELPTALTGGGA